MTVNPLLRLPMPPVPGDETAGLDAALATARITLHWFATSTDLPTWARAASGDALAKILAVVDDL